MSTRHRVLSLLCVLVFAGLLVADENPAGSLGLELMVDKDVLAAGDELALRYVVRNGSDHPVHILAGRHCLGFTIYNKDSKKPLKLENPPGVDIFTAYAAEDDLVLLKPGETYAFEECLSLKKEEGELFLQFYGDKFRVPSSGVTIGARFLSRKYNQDKADHAGFKVKLYDGEDLYSEVTMTRDGDCLRKVEAEKKPVCQD